MWRYSIAFLFILTILFSCTTTKQAVSEKEGTIDTANANHIDFSSISKKLKNGDAKARETIILILGNNIHSRNRVSAARLIGDFKIKEANAQLVTSLKQDDDNVRAEVILAMGKVEIAQNFDTVLAVWKDKNESASVRTKALESLGYFSQEESVNTLAAALKQPAYKNIAVTALGNTKSPKAVKPLLGLLKENMSDSQAARSLYQLKEPDSYNPILTILDKKIDQYEFDRTFEILVNLIKDEKYAPAEEVLAKAYLVSPRRERKLKKLLIKTLKLIGIQNSYAVITAYSLRIRETTNTRSKVQGTVKAGEIVKILGKSKLKQNIDNIEDYWYKIQSKSGIVGWCFGGYMNKLDHENLPET